MAEPSKMTETALMRRIRSLIERAEHSKTSEHERQACLAKADALMFKNSIDRATVEALESKQTRIKRFDWDMPFDSEFFYYFSDMMGKVARHCRLKSVAGYRNLAVVGYEEDIMYGQMLWTTIHLEFARKINPGWSQHRDFDENVTLLKEAGEKWISIARIAMEHGYAESEVMGQKLGQAYKRQCKREGREPKRGTQRHRAYRQSFAESFFATITRRLHELEQSEDESIEDRDRILPALRVDEDKVQEVFWEHFPKLHPDAMKARAAKMRREAEEERRKQEEIWNNMTEEEREAERKRQERQERKWERMNRDNYIQVDPLGWEAGDKVAKSVNLTPGRGMPSNEKSELE